MNQQRTKTINIEESTFRVEFSLYPIVGADCFIYKDNSGKNIVLKLTKCFQDPVSVAVTPSEAKQLIAALKKTLAAL